MFASCDCLLLPSPQARGRRIEGRRAASLLCSKLPELVRHVMCYSSLNPAAVQQHVECVEDQDGMNCKRASPSLLQLRVLLQWAVAAVICYMPVGSCACCCVHPGMHTCMHVELDDCMFAAALRSQLRERNLTSFVANGSCLPRRSGVDDAPMTKEQVSRQAVTAPSSEAAKDAAPAAVRMIQ